MNALALLPEILAAPERLRPLRQDIHSLMPADPRAQLYDRFATAYDAVVATWLYNRTVWGNSPASCSGFADRALSDSQRGWFLDAGGGSLLFTARSYARRNDRPILVLNQSIMMLTRAQRRPMLESRGQAPDHVALVQADLRDISAVRAATMATILCLDVLHHIADASSLLSGLGALAALGSRLVLTSLVKRRRIADWYLKRLEHTAGFALARSADEVSSALKAAGFSAVKTCVRRRTFYAVGAR